MKFAASLVVAFATAYVSAITRCGDPAPPDSLISALNETDLFSEFKKRNIDTYVHVVTSAAKEGMYVGPMVLRVVDRLRHLLSLPSITLGTHNLLSTPRWMP
jgi:hypothetical protein